MRSFASRFALGVWHGPISRNLSGAIATQLCLLVSGTIAARLLGPQNRGYLAILTAWPSAIGQIGAVGMALAATYFLASDQIGGAELIAVLRRPVFIQIALLTLVDICVILGYIHISGAPILVAACISFLQLPAAGCLDYGFAFLLGARRHGLVNAFRSLAPALYAIGLIVLYVLQVRSLDIAVACLALSIVIASTIITSEGVRSVLRVRPTDSIVARLGITEARKSILAFGRKGYVGYLSPVDTFRIDQLIVGFLLSPEALGYYVVGAAFTNFARLVAYNVGLSSVPEIASQRTREERWRAVRHTLVLSAGVLVIITLALAALIPLVLPLLFGSEFTSSIPIAEILVVAGSVLAMKRIVVDTMRGAGETRVGTRAEIVNFVCFIALCGPLAIALGAPGVALALLLGSVAGSLVLVRNLHHLGVISRGLYPFRRPSPAIHER